MKTDNPFEHSLVVILVVVLGLALLNAMYSRVDQRRPDDDIGVTQAVLESVGFGLMDYKMKVGEFPANDLDLSDTFKDNKIEVHFRAKPIADYWGTPLTYHNANQTAVVSSAGRDKVHGTEDDINLEVLWEDNKDWGNAKFQNLAIWNKDQHGIKGNIVTRPFPEWFRSLGIETGD